MLEGLGVGAPCTTRSASPIAPRGLCRRVSQGALGVAAGLACGLLATAAWATPVRPLDTAEPAPTTSATTSPTASATASPLLSPCRGVAAKGVEPRVLLLGEAARVRLHAQVTCSPDDVPLHLVFALDGSNSMGDD